MTTKAAKAVQLERKPIVQLGLGLLATAGVYVAQQTSLLAHVPAAYQPFVAVLTGPVVGFLGGYLAKHTLRTDLEDVEAAVGLAPGQVPGYFPITPPNGSGVMNVADPAN